ncbi:E3 ubiquitin-protein ligase rnf8-like [Littorina saxatilis]|uniref:E3 ubiquitin-protein ligase CHFR n=1 Tax=Littorina saxatilis TaxID=31220 RepID=A0AAN9GFJ9_9CAEN
MTQAAPCLLSIGKTASKYRHFPFLDDHIKIGRAADATYTILSAMISRCHAVIQRQKDNTWTITDNKSLNGIAVNGKQLKAQEPYTLQESDVVQLGVPTAPDVPAEFVYRFFTSLKYRRENKKKRPCSRDDNPVKRFKGSGDKDEQSADSEQNAERGRAENVQAAEKGEAEQKVKAAYEEQLQALAQQLKDKEQEKSAIQEQLQQEREQRQVMEERQKEQEEKVCQLDAQQKQLVQEQAVAEEKMRQQLEEELRRRETLLREQMQQQLLSLATEKSQVEQRLQTEMEKAVQEKDRELQDRLHGEKDRLQKVIEAKELEQKALESQLAESRQENEKAKADTLTTRDAILSEFAETMETELQCSICNELFIKATSLNCSHAFCALCIRQWLAVKRECPNCRTAVASQMRSIVLDNYIDRMVAQLSEEMKERRAQLVVERQEAEKKLDEAEKKAQAGPSGARGRGGRQRGRGRGRGRTIEDVMAGQLTSMLTANRLTNLTTQLARGGANANRVTNLTAQAARGGATATATRAAAASGTTTRAAATTAAATATSAMNTTGVPTVGAQETVGPPDVTPTVTDGSVGTETMGDAAGAEAIVVSDNESVVITDSEEEGWDDSDDEMQFSEDWGTPRRHHGSDDSDNSENDDSDSTDGTGAYYGGYGRCYRCGCRGHWANGCPN